MFKNTASQKIAVFAFDTTTSAPKTGDAANITVYVNKDWAGVNALTDTSATEISSTNAPGWYLFDVSQTETNADALHFTGKSTTANVSVVGQTVYAQPANLSTLVIDGSGRVDVGKINGVATSSVTTVNANVGTTQPVNYTGTGASALVKSDMVDIAGAAVSTSTAQIGVNVIQAAGTAWASGAITSGVFATDSITAGALAASVSNEIADQVWDEQTSGHTTAGSTGKALLDVSGGSITFDTTSINAIADGILNRDMSVGTDSGSPTFRTPRQALRSLRNKWSIQGGTLTIYKEDDSTTSWTGVISTTADANPVTQTDPAGP